MLLYQWPVCIKITKCFNYCTVGYLRVHVNDCYMIVVQNNIKCRFVFVCFFLPHHSWSGPAYQWFSSHFSSPVTAANLLRKLRPVTKAQFALLTLQVSDFGVLRFCTGISLAQKPLMMRRKSGGDYDRKVAARRAAIYRCPPFFYIWPFVCCWDWRDAAAILFWQGSNKNFKK